MKITKYVEAFELIGVTYSDKIKERLKFLEKEGYKESNICFAIWKSQDKLMSFRGDDRFWNILCNEIRKHAFKSKQ